MGDNGAGRPAARAVAPPPVPTGGDGSGARLAPARSEGVPTTPARPVGANWELGTAPTLLLKPVDADDAISTSRIPTPAPIVAEEQPWFRTGTTVPPPSMRPPMAESVAPGSLRKPPSLRALTAVFGVIAACLFIVAMAGWKILYKRQHAPALAPTATEESSAPKVAIAEPAKAQPVAPEATPPAEQPPSAPESAAPGGASTASAPAPARTSPARTTTKTTTRRPLPKKAVRGAH